MSSFPWQLPTFLPMDSSYFSQDTFFVWITTNNGFHITIRNVSTYKPDQYHNIANILRSEQGIIMMSPWISYGIDRFKVHSSMLYWMWLLCHAETFCPNCSGKSTLACSLSRELHSRGKLSYILDGDNLRHGLNKNLSFKPEDRTENIRRVGEYFLLTTNIYWGLELSVQ